MQAHTAGRRPLRLSVLFTFAGWFSAPSVQGPGAFPVLFPPGFFPDDVPLVPNGSAAARTPHMRVRAHRHSGGRTGPFRLSLHCFESS